MKYVETSILVEKDKKDALVDYIISSGIESYEEVSRDILNELDQNEKDWDFIDDKQVTDIINVADNKFIIRFYVNEEDFKTKSALVKDLEKFGELTIKTVDDKDWENAWKKFFKPTKIGENIVIKPTWEDYQTDKSDIVIEMDPGMAFGSGTHETTTLCLELIEKFIKKDDLLFDIGCGSGILSIAAGLLGAKHVIGVDIDTLAVKVAKENVKANNLSEKIDILQGDLFEVVSGQANIIVSNIIAEIIVNMVCDLKSKLLPQGIFICSGIISNKSNLVKEKLEDLNYKILEVRQRGEWVAIVAQRQDA